MRTPDDSHVDHEAPHTFQALVAAFIARWPPEEARERLWLQHDDASLPAFADESTAAAR